MREKRKPMKRVFFIENVLALILAILCVWWSISSLVFMVTEKTGEWYNYMFVVFVGILQLIVGTALIRSLIGILKKEKEP